jgi:hypothetical protein
MGSGFGIDSWIIVGTVTGWVTALLTETVEQFEWLENVLVGILARSFPTRTVRAKMSEEAHHASLWRRGVSQEDDHAYCG